MSETIAVTGYARLSDEDRAAVGELATQVRAAGIDPRLTLEWLAARAGNQPADWLAHASGRLVGVMATERFGEQVEATIAAAPDAPAGATEALFAALLEEMPRQGIRRILLLHDRKAEPLRRLAETHGLVHHHAELMMRRPAELPAPDAPTGPLLVRAAAEAELPLVAQVIATDWGGDAADVLGHLRSGVARGYSYYLATLDGEPVSALNVQVIDGRPWVYGFSVLAAHRGRGFGRQMLAATLRDVLASSPGEVFLEVEPNNAAAVHLYQSLGFAELRTFDYWAKELADDTHP